MDEATASQGSWRPGSFHHGCLRHRQLPQLASVLSCLTCHQPQTAEAGKGKEDEDNLAQLSLLRSAGVYGYVCQRLHLAEVLDSTCKTC